MLSLILVCTATVTQLTDVPGVGVKEEEICVGDRVDLGLTSGVDFAAIKLTGKREVISIGGTPTIGGRVGWKPSFWTVSDTLLGVDATVGMTALDLNDPEDRVFVWLVGHLNLLGWVTVGVGGRFGIATKDKVKDIADLVLTGGLRVPF